MLPLYGWKLFYNNARCFLTAMRKENHFCLLTTQIVCNLIAKHMSQHFEPTPCKKSIFEIWTSFWVERFIKPCRLSCLIINLWVWIIILLIHILQLHVYSYKPIQQVRVTYSMWHQALTMQVISHLQHSVSFDIRVLGELRWHQSHHLYIPAHHNMYREWT